MAYLHGKFVWFEHVSNDVAAARRFYGELFGWKSEGIDIGGQTYHMIENGAEGIGGFRAAMPGVPNHWMCYLSVADVDASAAAAQQAGAKLLMPPTDFAPVGRGATLADPTGAVFSIWKDAQGDRPDVHPPAAGDFCWNELLSTDAPRALEFYQRVFGYGHDVKDIGPAGKYYILKAGEAMRGGLMQAPMPGVPSHWLPYVAVADVDGGAATAARLGAQVVVPPDDIPEVGRFAVLLDPLHAAVALFRGAPQG